MDQEEFENDNQLKESIRTRERQYAGLDRHFRGPDGFGWFSHDPNLIAPEMLQRARFPVKQVEDLSDEEAFVEGKQHKLSSGSFSIEMDYGSPGLGGGVFIFSHPKDIEEFLKRAGVEKPGELIGKEMIQYWIGVDQEPRAGEPTVGVDLPEFRIPLGELTKNDRGK